MRAVNGAGPLVRWGSLAVALAALATACSSGTSGTARSAAAGSPSVAASASTTCARFVGHSDDTVAMLRTDLTIATEAKIAAEWGDGSESSANALKTWATTVDSLKDSAAAEGQSQIAADAAALAEAIRAFADGSTGGQGSASPENVTRAAAMSAAVKKLGTDCAWDGKP